MTADDVEAGPMRDAGVLIDSGLMYCTAHHGVIECDGGGDPCDFAYSRIPEHNCSTCNGQGYIEDGHGGGGSCEDCDGQGVTRCLPTPLLYASTPSEER